VLFRRRDSKLDAGAALPAAVDTPGSAAGGRTLVGRHTRIVGKIFGDGPVVVRGAVNGTIALRGGLWVRSGGRIEADVEAQSVDLEGNARGKISATTRVSLSETGEFEGEMDTPILEVCPGSIVRGRARVAGFPTRDRRNSH
jgi:cytoskeletal protein CcmA (bactofilin family)